MTYNHLTDEELTRRVIMGGEGGPLARELALRLERAIEEIDDMRCESVENLELCPHCAEPL